MNEKESRTNKKKHINIWQVWVQCIKKRINYLINFE